MTDRHDYLALDWVRGEIQETLNQAQQALEAFVENPDDSTRMRFCQTYLHQVYGTLQMVEFYGAALLAEEMEKLAQALLDDKVSQLADAQETLMRAILQLPPYLDRVQASRRDLPLVLLPLLNDLRASRGESLLSETSLFKPDLAGAASHGAVPQSVFEDESFPLLIRKIRQMYQIALLGVIRGEDLASNYGFMAKVFTKLKQVSGDSGMSPLWQVAGGMVEGLTLGAIQPGTSVKSVLGQLDRVLRELSSAGAPLLNDAPPAELMKNLLYYIAKSEADGPILTQVREKYRLSDALPSEELISSERAKMSGPDQAAMASVVMALSEEINKVKEALETFVHNDETDGSKLKPQSQILKQVADTVAVLGLGQPRKLVEDQLEVIDAIAAGTMAAERSVLMDVAGALLYVEATLQGMTGDRRSVERQGALAIVPDHVAKARDAVIRECRAALEEAKDGIVEFIASQWQKSHLSEVPAKLTVARGGLAMILLTRPAAVLGQCVSYITNELLQEESDKPDWRSMDTLADAITSVEYYLERITDDPESGDEVLDLARNSVAMLGYPIDDNDFGRGADELQGEQREAGGLSALASEEINLDELPQQEPDLTSELELEAYAEESLSDELQLDEPQPEKSQPDEPLEIDLSLPAADAASTTAAAAASTTAAAAESASSAFVPERAEAGEDDLIDDEIVEIFVEEAGEVLEALNEYFPRWASNQNDEEALIEFRRAFHTLKGSGRMVGATTVGELAWSIENMMNRVIDKTIVTSPILIELVRTVHGLIPALVDAFAQRTENPWDVTPLSDAAFTLATGGSIAVVPDVTAAVAGETAVAELEVEAAPHVEASDAEDDDSDDVLLDIFKSEAHANIGLLRDWLAGIDEDLSENSLNDTVYRAFHTLKGSAKMAGVPAVAVLAAPAEAYTRALAGAGGTADRDAVSLIRDVTDAFEQGLSGAELTAGEDIVIPATDALIKRLDEAMAHADSNTGTDPQRISDFLATGMDLILDADSLLASWAQNPTQAAGLEKLRDELKQLSEAADAEIGRAHV